MESNEIQELPQLPLGEERHSSPEHLDALIQQLNEPGRVLKRYCGDGEKFYSQLGGLLQENAGNFAQNFSDAEWQDVASGIAFQQDASRVVRSVESLRGDRELQIDESPWRRRARKAGGYLAIDGASAFKVAAWYGILWALPYGKQIIEGLQQAGLIGKRAAAGLLLAAGPEYYLQALGLHILDKGGKSKLGGQATGMAVDYGGSALVLGVQDRSSPNPLPPYQFLAPVAAFTGALLQSGIAEKIFRTETNPPPFDINNLVVPEKIATITVDSPTHQKIVAHLQESGKNVDDYHHNGEFQVYRDRSQPGHRHWFIVRHNGDEHARPHAIEFEEDDQKRIDGEMVRVPSELPSQQVFLQAEKLWNIIDNAPSGKALREAVDAFGKTVRLLEQIDELTNEQRAAQSGERDANQQHPAEQRGTTSSNRNGSPQAEGNDAVLDMGSERLQGEELQQLRRRFADGRGDIPASHKQLLKGLSKHHSALEKQSGRHKYLRNIVLAALGGTGVTGIMGATLLKDKPSWRGFTLGVGSTSAQTLAQWAQYLFPRTKSLPQKWVRSWPFLGVEYPMLHGSIAATQEANKRSEISGNPLDAFPSEATVRNWQNCAFMAQTQMIGVRFGEATVAGAIGTGLNCGTAALMTGLEYYNYRRASSAPTISPRDDSIADMVWEMAKGRDANTANTTNPLVTSTAVTAPSITTGSRSSGYGASLSAGADSAALAFGNIALLHVASKWIGSGSARAGSVVRNAAARVRPASSRR